MQDVAYKGGAFEGEQGMRATESLQVGALEDLVRYVLLEFTGEQAWKRE